MSTTFDPPPIPLGRDAATIRVVRYDRTKANNWFAPLPNVVALAVQVRDGDSLPVARFRYQLSILNDPAYPLRVEDVAGLDKSGPYIVKQDDRLCVLKDNADGGVTILFDGFAQVPQVDASKDGESATFEAIGVAVREWDTPLGGATFRNTIDDNNYVVQGLTTTERPTRFNPDGIGNSTPEVDAIGPAGPWLAGADALTKYPPFMDAYKLDGSGQQTTDFVTGLWSVAGAAKYILATGNPKQKYVSLPDLTSLDDLLSAKSPTSGDAFDPADPSNTTTTPIPCQDLDVTGEPWPTALEKLIRPHGFDFAFVLDQTGIGAPITRLVIFRVDDADEVAPKSVYLQAAGATFDPGATNTAGFSIQRDASKIANQITLDTRLIRYETSVILAPGFTPLGADMNASKTALTKYEIGDPLNIGDDADRYRVYVLDETGEGHYDYGLASFVTTSSNLDKIFGPPITDPVTGLPDREYAARRRPAISRLFSTVKGKPLSAQLWMSAAYGTLKPGVYDGTATDWQRIADDDWELLKDRCGVRITAKSVEDISILNPVSTGPARTKKFRLLSSQANLSNVGTGPARVMLRLTCVLEGDQTPGITANRRTSSLSQYTISRRINVRDRFVRNVVAKSSHLNAAGKEVMARDDYDRATAFAEAMRTAHEQAKFAGSITIPRIATAYAVGDKIDMIRGRNISLRTNTGKAQGEAAEYPVVVGVSWTFDGNQSTVLQISDRRAEPPAWHTT